MLSSMIGRDLAASPGSSLLGNESLRPRKNVELVVMGFQGKTDRNKPLKLRALVVA